MPPMTDASGRPRRGWFHVAAGQLPAKRRAAGRGNGWGTAMRRSGIVRRRDGGGGRLVPVHKTAATMPYNVRKGAQASFGAGWCLGRLPPPCRCAPRSGWKLSALSAPTAHRGGDGGCLPPAGEVNGTHNRGQANAGALARADVAGRGMRISRNNPTRGWRVRRAGMVGVRAGRRGWRWWRGAEFGLRATTLCAQRLARRPLPPPPSLKGRGRA